ncbi:FkbM family methyltransferase [Candidatus Parcubacteria bacterium]|nr:FkbM family methyltransferase [Candidatus Parcubacteria bacterium]
MTKQAQDLVGLLTLADGTKFRIRLNVKPVTDTHMIYESWGRQDYTPADFTVKDDAVVIDVGAHIGAFSLYAAKLAKNGHIYSYEPHPQNFDLLQENIILNHAGNINPFQLGVLGKRQQAELYIDEKNDAGHSLYSKGERTVEIECIPLANVFDDNGLEFCDLLKIDCEGAEYDILLNTPKEYLVKIGMIAMEYHDGMYGRSTVRDLRAWLENSGFSVRLQGPGAVQGLLYAKRRV